MSATNSKEIFAENLSFYIKKHDVDQKDIAEAIGIAPSTFNAYVKAKKYPRIDKIEKIANYFGISKSDLIEKQEKVNGTIPSITADEHELLELYRKIPEKQQKLVLEIINVVISGSSR